MCLKYLRNRGSFIRNLSLTSIGMAFRPSLDLGSSPNNPSFPDGCQMLYLTIILILIYSTYALTRNGSDVRELNPRKRSELTDIRRMGEYMQNSRDLMTQGKSNLGRDPWRLCSEWGNVIVPLPEFLHELRSHPKLTFSEAARDVSSSLHIYVDIFLIQNIDSHAYVSRFDPFEEGIRCGLLYQIH